MKTFMRSLIVLAACLVAMASARAEEIFLQSEHSGLFVTVVNGTLAANARSVDTAIRLDRIAMEGGRVAFRDPRTGTFVRAGVGPDSFLATGSPHIRGWETFEITPMGRGKVALRSMQNDRFVRAGVGRRSHLAAASVDPGSWETFRMINAGTVGQNQAGNQGGNQGSGRPSAQGAGLADIFGNYFITHVAADNGFLVQLGRQLASQARLSVDDGGTVRASVGCNSMTVRISVREGRVQARGPGMSTRMMCNQQGVMAAERQVMQALETARRVVRDRRTVTFMAANGTELLKLQKR